MGHNPKKYNRRTTRLKGYDYSSPGRYFVTICTHNRLCLFGEINDGKMMLNEWGRIARDQWLETESIRDNVILDTFVIMPNHVHGIVQITGYDRNIGADYDTGPYHSVGAYRHTPLQNRNTSHHDHNSSIQNDSPNHQSGFRSPSKTLGVIVRGYKSAVTTRINKKQNNPGQKVWQRNYHDHIIRDKQSLERIRHYIINNPAQWENDRNNPGNIS